MNHPANKVKENRDPKRYLYIAQLVTQTRMTTKELIRYSTKELGQMYENLLK